MLNTNHARDQPWLFSCPIVFQKSQNNNYYELRKENAK